MSGMNTAAPDPAQELGAEDEVTAFNNEEEGEYEGDESLNDIKDELQLEADSDKTKVRACVSTCALGPCAFCAAAYVYCCCLCVTPADVLWTPTNYYWLVASGAGASEVHQTVVNAFNVSLYFLPSHCPSISSEPTHIFGTLSVQACFLHTLHVQW